MFWVQKPVHPLYSKTQTVKTVLIIFVDWSKSAFSKTIKTKKTPNLTNIPHNKIPNFNLFNVFLQFQFQVVINVCCGSGGKKEVGYLSDVQKWERKGSVVLMLTLKVFQGTVRLFFRCFGWTILLSSIIHTLFSCGPFLFLTHQHSLFSPPLHFFFVTKITKALCFVVQLEVKACFMV